MPLTTKDTDKKDDGKGGESQTTPPQMPPAEETQEPDKFVPPKDHQSYDTPSGRALAKAGAPDPDDAGSDKERQRGQKYLSEKSKMRWGYSQIENQ